MKKIDKKSLIIILILLINIGLITIPYNIKNINLEKQHKNMTKKAENTSNEVDFYAVYDDFNKVLQELNVKYESKQMELKQDSAFITLKLKSDVIGIANMLVYINKKIPNMMVTSADISKNKEQESEIIFYVGSDNV